MYGIMTNNNFKNNKTKIQNVSIAGALCAILVLSMISPIIVQNKAFAVDDKYYLRQYTTTYEQLGQIIIQSSALEKQISDLKAANASGNNEKIQQLQQQIDANNNKRQSLVQELDHIQNESRALFQVDPATKKKLDNASTVLYEKYLNRKSPTYVGENPVQEIIANYEYKDLFVSFDPDKTINNPAGDQSQAIIADIKKVAGDIPLDISYAKIKPIQCSTRTAPCSPLVAGVSAQTSGNSNKCTEGYQATDINGNPGFIMAGHCSVYNGAVYQPATGFTGSRQVGQITQICYDTSNPPSCDFAFAKASVSMSTWIFIDGSSWYVMYDKTPQSNQSPGTIVLLSGYGSNAVISGTLIGFDSGHHAQVSMAAKGGDSGAPVFENIDGTNVHMFGEAYASDGTTYTYYFPEDFIKSTLGLQN